MRSRLIGRDDVAQALNMSSDEFENKLEHLRLLNFPEPVTGQQWAVSDLLDWIVMRQEEMVKFVSHLSDFLEK